MGRYPSDFIVSPFPRDSTSSSLLAKTPGVVSLALSSPSVSVQELPSISGVLAFDTQSPPPVFSPGASIVRSRTPVPLVLQPSVPRSIILTNTRGTHQGHLQLRNELSVPVRVTEAPITWNMTFSADGYNSAEWLPPGSVDSLGVEELIIPAGSTYSLSAHATDIARLTISSS